MIEAISHKILNFIMMHSDIDEDMSDIYKYGIEFQPFHCFLVLFHENIF